MSNDKVNPLASVMIFFVMIGGMFKFLKKHGPKILDAMGDMLRSFVETLFHVLSFLFFPALIILGLVVVYYFSKWLYKKTWLRIVSHQRELERVWERLERIDSNLDSIKSEHYRGYTYVKGQVSGHRNLLLKLKDFTGYAAYEQSQKALKEIVPQAGSRGRSK